MRPRRSVFSSTIGPISSAATPSPNSKKQTGIKVTYDVYDSEETMDARLLAGSSGYDVVIASTEYFGREIKAGVYVPLDRSKLPNWKNLESAILVIQAVHDPGNQHSVPYLHAITALPTTSI